MEQISLDSFGTKKPGRSAGAQLIAKYYQAKYQCRITFFIPICNYDDYVDAIEEFFIGPFSQHLTDHADTKQEAREAILVNFGKVHTIPIILLKDEKQSAILYANSLLVGSREQEILAGISKKYSIPIYFIPHARQSDANSCRNDALIIGRDITAKDKDGYRVKNVLAFLRTNGTATKDPGVYSLKRVPIQLMKSAQISPFVKQFSDEKDFSSEVIHKQQTVQIFRNRYTFQAAMVMDSGGNKFIKNVAAYSIKKGLKNRNIIKIQFYVDQFAMILADKWTAELAKDFIAKSKVFMQEKSKLTDKELIVQYHQFSEKMLLHYKENTTSLLSRFAAWITLSQDNLIAELSTAERVESQSRRAFFLTSSR